MDYYDTLSKKAVYNFNVGNGGIGDLTKYFMYLLTVCMKHNIQIYYLVNGEPIEQFLKMRYPKMYITTDKIKEKSYRSIRDVSQLTESIEHDTYYILAPSAFYSVFPWSDVDAVHQKITQPFSDAFVFADAVIRNVPFVIPANYISIHVRLGDKFLETDPAFIVGNKNDVRAFDEAAICAFIEKNEDKSILFFCDNRSYKRKMATRYPNITVTDYEIGHTGLRNTTATQTLNTTMDFFLMTESEHIYMASYSGFSITAAKFRNIPVTLLKG